MFTFPTDLQSFIVWLGTTGAGGVIVAMLLERIPAFRNWKSPAKGHTVMALFVALPFLSAGGQWALSRLDPAILANVQWALGSALTGLLAWGASQYGHKSDPHYEARDEEAWLASLHPTTSYSVGTTATGTGSEQTG